MLKKILWYVLLISVFLLIIVHYLSIQSRIISDELGLFAYLFPWGISSVLLYKYISDKKGLNTNNVFHYVYFLIGIFVGIIFFFLNYFVMFLFLYLPVIVFILILIVTARKYVFR